MPLIQDSLDSLPHIDGDLSPSTRSQVSALLAAELPPDYTSTPHPLLPDPLPPRFSPFIDSEFERISSKQPLTAIDTTRYEALEAPPPTSPKSDERSPELLESWRETLRRAYATSTHLSIRLQNLALLESFGKNAWLIGNSQLEEILRGLEKELVETKERVEEVNKERYESQEGVRGEMEGLEASWRASVGRLVEVEVAAEEMRMEILERRRQGAT
ncbi:MAG: hypothetical protein Q9187_001185 [Circinaria calcarea]